MPSILITGSNRGLGLEWTRQYLQLGWQVHATCRHPEEADELHQLKRAHDNMSLFRLDVTRPDEINTVADQLSDQAIDILVNNAGVYLEKFDKSTLGHFDYGDWEKTFRINTLGPVRITQAFTKHVARSTRRLVVNISSHMGSIAEIESPGSYAYRSSKAALNAATKGLALELQQQNVGLLLLHPGWVKTRMGGAGALFSTQESVDGMRSVIDRFDMDISGAFYHFKGNVIPW